MKTEHFFEEQREQSLIKSEIVSKYFDAWASVIIKVLEKKKAFHPIAYVDLFAGPGRYEDGTISTPVKILQKAISNPEYQERLICIFNDKSKKNSQSLEEIINTMPGIENIKNKPRVYNSEIDEGIIELFEMTRFYPALFFIDPWGYKGLSLRLIKSIIKDWGCDCIFFFNYNRINMGINNACVEEHINALFGKSKAPQIRHELSGLSSQQREFKIIEELCFALKKLGGKFTLPFCFKSVDGKRTSHHLIFVSKHFKGYEIMKEIMAKESSAHDEGVASFGYNPVDRYESTQGLLYKLTRPLDELAEELLTAFSGQTIKMCDIYKCHSIDTPYIKKNYKDVLLDLEEKNKISASKHRRNTFGDDVLVTFPIR